MQLFSLVRQRSKEITRQRGGINAKGTKTKGFTLLPLCLAAFFKLLNRNVFRCSGFFSLFGLW